MQVVRLCPYSCTAVPCAAKGSSDTACKEKTTGACGSPTQVAGNKDMLFKVNRASHSTYII